MSVSQRIRRFFLPTATGIYWPGALCVLGAIAFPMIVSRLPLGSARTVAGYVGLFCWIALPIIVPIVALKAGVVRTKTSTSFRGNETLRFWVGLCAVECLAVFLAVLACIFFFKLLG